MRSPRLHRLRSLPALLVAFVCTASFIFLKLLSEIAEGETQNVDEAILRLFRDRADLSQPVGPLWVRIAVTDITALGSAPVLGLIVVLTASFLISEGKRRAAGFLAVSVAGGAALSLALKDFIARPRPTIVTHIVDVTTMSFPSGHAMLSAVTFLTLGALVARQIENGRTRVVVMASAILVTMLVGLSRVYLGVHYPTDVVGGWCAGGAWAAVFALLADLREPGAAGHKGKR